ncbi:MAG: tRNA pseudouridine(55) synthase, partial [Calditrichaeota bacterium]|nr:tRNA pseudouridine(55) synthase [Calditrichota bacterium]
PAFSAAKIGGQRSYKLARAGKAVPHRTKWVRVDQLTLEDLNDTCLTVRVSCGKGTYIRTLGRDIARALGSAGHLSRLVRTRVGEYTLEKALNLEAFQHNWQERTALPK